MLLLCEKVKQGPTEQPNSNSTKRDGKTSRKEPSLQVSRCCGAALAWVGKRRRTVPSLRSLLCVAPVTPVLLECKGGRLGGWSRPPFWALGRELQAPPRRGRSPAKQGHSLHSLHSKACVRESRDQRACVVVRLSRRFLPTGRRSRLIRRADSESRAQGWAVLLAASRPFLKLGARRFFGRGSVGSLPSFFLFFPTLFPFSVIK